MDGVIEPEEGHKGVLILVLYLLGRLLKAGEHGALTARQMLAGIAVLSDLREYLLHDDKLVGHKGEVGRELSRAAEPLDIRLGGVGGKTEDVPQLRFLVLIELLKEGGGLWRLFQDPLLDYFVHRGGGEGEPGPEPGLNAGKLIGADFDDLVYRLLPGTHDPDLPAALAADFLGQRLKVQQHVGVGAHILPHLVDHEQEPEALRPAVHILLHVPHQLGDAQLYRGLVLEPGPRVLLAHVQGLHQGRDDRLAVEGEGPACLHPRLALLFLEYPAEFLRLAALGDVVLQHGDLEVFAVEAQMVIKHLREDPQDRRFVLGDGPLDVDIEEDGLSLVLGRPVYQREGVRIVLKLFPETLGGFDAVDGFVFQDVGEHF